MQESLVYSSFKYCEELTRSHYENFPVASLLIPKKYRKYIYAIYAFARAADDFADEPYIEGGKEKRLALLNEWNIKLRDCYNGKAYDPIFIALGQTVKDCKIPIELFESLLKAFKQDVVQNTYSNFDEVLEYCENSANPIGRLVLIVFGINDEEKFRYSDKICTALQLVNFWQDVSVDLEKDRIYIPQDAMVKFSYSGSELAKRDYSEKFARLMRSLVETTETIFDEGKELLKLIRNEGNSKRLSWELNLTWLGGKEILEKIKLLNYDVLHTRPKLNLFDKIKLITKAKFLK